MYHRYAVEGAASMVAGQDFIYGMRGDNRTPTKGVSVDDQRKALDALAVTLRPAELTVPKPVLDLIPPRPPGWGLHRELFPRTTGDTFDPLSPATVAADVTIGFVLQLDRASRMVAQHAVNAQYPGLEDVIDRLITATWDAPTATPYEAAIRRAEEKVLVDRVMWLALASPNSQVRAIASMKLSKLAARAKTAVNKTELDTAQRTLIAADIKRFLERPLDLQRPIAQPAPDAPPGAPIGDPGPDWLAPAPWYPRAPFNWDYWQEPLM
jgi:hypothetical protein